MRVRHYCGVNDSGNDFPGRWEGGWALVMCIFDDSRMPVLICRALRMPGLHIQC